MSSQQMEPEVHLDGLVIVTATALIPDHTNQAEHFQDWQQELIQSESETIIPGMWLLEL